VGVTATTNAKGQRVKLRDGNSKIQFGGAFGTLGASGLSKEKVLFSDQLNGVFSTTVGAIAGRQASATSLDNQFGEWATKDEVYTISDEKGLTLSYASRRDDLKLRAGDLARSLNSRKYDGFDQAMMLNAVMKDGNAVSAGLGISMDRTLGFNSAIEIRTRKSAFDLPVLGFSSDKQMWGAYTFNGGKHTAKFGFFQNEGDSLLSLDKTLVSGREGDTIRSSGAVADFVYSGFKLADINLTAGYLSENGSVLGGAMKGEFATKPAESTFARIGVMRNLSDKWNLKGQYMFAQTEAKFQQGALARIGNLSDVTSDSFALGINGRDILRVNDRFSLTLSQPLRVNGGTATVRFANGINFRKPGDFDLTNTDRQVSLSPSGREMRLTSEYGFTLLPNVEMNLGAMLVNNAGHDTRKGLSAGGFLGLKAKF